MMEGGGGSSASVCPAARGTLPPSPTWYRCRQASRGTRQVSFKVQLLQVGAELQTPPGPWLRRGLQAAKLWTKGQPDHRLGPLAGIHVILPLRPNLGVKTTSGNLGLQKLARSVNELRGEGLGIGAMAPLALCPALCWSRSRKRLLPEAPEPSAAPDSTRQFQHRDLRVLPPHLRHTSHPREA